ncbi:MAG TPA: NAD+ synthase [Verrucomicrobia bacterium]|nr:MAG: hypothetical protein A2X46_07215 [Lentisphaerae bacterium GWF2_57_35]HBA83242.1 NAD+ synthase [Verrucomicrobiota bacterium]
MNGLSIALIQTNTTVGALAANADKMVQLAHKAAQNGADILVFPELVLSGYPPEDLILKQHFTEDCRKQLHRMAKELPADRLVILGSPSGAHAKTYNAAVVFHGGQIAATYHKMLLPNYGVFDEKRVFLAGHRAMVLQYGAVRIGLHVCEDSWFPDEAACALLKPAGLNVLINISASPYHRGKLGVRENVMRQTALAVGAPLLYCNLTGGQDELVFDGASMALNAAGQVIVRAKQFADDILHVSLPMHLAATPSPTELPMVDLCAIEPKASASTAFPVRIEEPLEDLAEVYEALKTGLRDYVGKNGFGRTVAALSGGIDSALVAAIAVDALGAQRVVGVTMPSQFSSQATRGDAMKLANNLNIEFHTLPIQELFAAYRQQLADIWAGMPADSAEENLQARIRGNLIMALSNKFGWMVLTTGNKSELATGYCTLYGDMAGGFAVIKDVPKTLVFELARWRNRQPGGAVIPPSTIERPPTAELRDNQKDSDSLPPYEILDPILERYVEHDQGAADIIAEGFDPETVRKVVRLVDLNEYKRRQGAPGIKITPKAFGRDRRMPITNLYR